MGGMAVSFSNFTDIQNNEGLSANHAGETNILLTNFYGLYGLSDKLNLTISFPYKYWKQYAVEHEDTHHRNQVLNGPGDITLGLRSIIINEFFGPGQRLFIDGALTFPSGKDYKINPFGDAADSVNHVHFALGTGQVSYALGGEWWRRSEFPYIIGISSKFKQALTESKAGFKPGSAAGLTLHAIRQAPLIKSVFPYLKMELRREWPDRWKGKTAPNSGAVFLDLSGQLIYEMSENSSVVFTIGYPAWEDVDGSQLSGLNYALSYRYSN